MIKLDWITPSNRFAPPCEHWDIGGDIKVTITRYDTYAMISIWHISGDIADQVYTLMNSIEYYSDLKLDSTSNYTIDVPLEKVEKFLQFVEKIAAVLEEFLHGTQYKLGIVDRLGELGAEVQVKDFMIRHNKLLGLHPRDVEILRILRGREMEVFDAFHSRTYR